MLFLLLLTFCKYERTNLFSTTKDKDKIYVQGILKEREFRNKNMFLKFSIISPLLEKIVRKKQF